MTVSNAPPVTYGISRDMVANRYHLSVAIALGSAQTAANWGDTAQRMENQSMLEDWSAFYSTAVTY